jgi:hypothetical protein
MISTDGLKCPAAVTAVWCSIRQPRKRGVYQRGRLQRTPAPSHILTSPSSTFRCAHRSVRHHERPLPWKASRLRDSSAGFCLEETMGLRSGGSGVCGVRGRLLAAGSRRYGRPSSATSLTGQHGNSATTVWWIAGSGGGQGLWPATAPCKSSPHCRRNPNNPHAEKVRPHRARQNNVSEPALVAGVGDHWQATLTITGSNVRLGTEMPVALSSFLI